MNEESAERGTEMEPKDLLHATPFEMWKRAECWEKNARSAQEEVAELTHRLEEMQDELLSREEAVIGMEAERDAFLDEIEKLSARQERKPIPGSFQDSDGDILNRLKAMWQAEALEEDDGLAAQAEVLHKIGSALDLPPGTDLTRHALPAVVALQAERKFLAAHVHWIKYGER